MSNENSVVILVICLACTTLAFAESTCPRPKDLKETWSTITNHYMVASFERPSLKSSERSSPNAISHQSCNYKMVETKKNHFQFPESLETAVCEWEGKKLCDMEKCKPIVYMAPVLQKSESCEGAIGQKIWTFKQIPITVSFQFTY